MKLTDFKALTFDVYGTLIDWETGMVESLTPLADRAERELSRDEILEAHARHESTQQRYTPGRNYQHLLATVYRRLAEEWGVSVSWEECCAYGRSVRDWEPFPDTVEALRYLKQHYKLVILSNVDNESVGYSTAKLGVEFDAIYTAEDIGSYKPADRNFEYMLEKIGDIGVGKSEILHTAESLYHDHAPANRHGLASCHIFRRHDQEGFGATIRPETMPSIDFRFNSMEELAEAVRAES